MIRISRARAGPTQMLEYKIRRVRIADFTMNLVCVNPVGIIQQGPTLVTTSLMHPQKLSRKILSELLKYQI